MAGGWASIAEGAHCFLPLLLLPLRLLGLPMVIPAPRPYDQSSPSAETDTVPFFLSTSMLIGTLPLLFLSLHQASEKLENSLWSKFAYALINAKVPAKMFT